MKPEGKPAYCNETHNMCGSSRSLTADLGYKEDSVTHDVSAPVWMKNNPSVLMIVSVLPRRFFKRSFTENRQYESNEPSKTASCLEEVVTQCSDGYAFICNGTTAEHVEEPLSEGVIGLSNLHGKRDETSMFSHIDDLQILGRLLCNTSS